VPLVVTTVPEASNTPPPSGPLPILDSGIGLPVVESAILSSPGLVDLVLVGAGCGTGLALQTLDLGAPAIREVAYERVDQDGEDDETSLFGARIVSANVTLYSEGDLTPAATLDRLLSFCSPRLRPRLTFRLIGQDERQVTLRALPFGAPLGLPGYSTIIAQVQWKAPDGRILSTALNTARLGPAGVGVETGRSYDLVPDRAYPGFTGGGQSVTVGGNIPTNPVIRIYGPCTNPKIENATVGRTLEFTGLTVASGDYLELDVTARTVRINGSAAVGDNRYGNLNFAVSQWWSLVPGFNNVRYYPATASAPSAAQITWQNGWL